MKTALYDEETRKRLFPFVAGDIHLDAAAEPPLPEPAYQAYRDFLDRYRLRGGLDFAAWQDELELCRGAVARLIGAPDTRGVALVKNTASGSRCVAWSLPLGREDVIYSNTLEYPSNLWPFEEAAERAGAMVTRIPAEGLTTPARLAEMRFDKRPPGEPPPKAIVWSWVQFRDGYRSDLQALTALGARTGAWIAIDAVQGLGAVPFSLQASPVDALYASGHKWMLGPGGAGFLYLKPERLGQLKPFGRGWLSAENPFAMDLDGKIRKDARRFEDGTAAVGSFYALRASLELLLKVGVEEVWLHIQHLQDHLRQKALRKGYQAASSQERAERGPILSLRVPRGDAQAIVTDLAARRIHLTARAGLLRVAPHLYNTIEEMDAVADALP